MHHEEQCKSAVAKAAHRMLMKLTPGERKRERERDWRSRMIVNAMKKRSRHCDGQPQQTAMGFMVTHIDHSIILFCSFIDTHPVLWFKAGNVVLNLFFFCKFL